MKLLFLDFDGVVNHQRFYIDRHEGRNNAKSRPHPLNEIDFESVALLNLIIEQTGARVVVSSTWRKDHTAAELQQILTDCGFRGEVIGTTPDYRHLGEFVFRGNEIYAWMDKHRDLLGKKLHEYRDYVIIDDDSDVLYWQRNNFILVDRFVGITPGTVYQAVKILNQG